MDERSRNAVLSGFDRKMASVLSGLIKNTISPVPYKKLT